MLLRDGVSVAVGEVSRWADGRSQEACGVSRRVIAAELYGGDSAAWSAPPGWPAVLAAGRPMSGGCWEEGPRS